MFQTTNQMVLFPLKNQASTQVRFLPAPWWRWWPNSRHCPSSPRGGRRMCSERRFSSVFDGSNGGVLSHRGYPLWSSSISTDGPFPSRPLLLGTPMAMETPKGFWRQNYEENHLHRYTHQIRIRGQEQHQDGFPPNVVHVHEAEPRTFSADDTRWIQRGLW